MSLRAFKALLRLAKAETEARSAAMAQAERALSAAQAIVADHDLQIECERAAAMSDGDSLMAYGSFFKRAQTQRQTLAMRVQTAELFADHVRVQLTQALVEQNKLESMVDQAEETERQRLEAVERAALDEAATLRYARPSKA
jgi:flagellar export protein FliJ